ncbi:alkaline phosphatase family protein [Arthrobacter rhombi]|uniref:alkaline phosphatase family protein n=1 Tax=Arthrobacter rhombi TaxID=71253 RepID=UPI003F93CE94
MSTTRTPRLEPAEPLPAPPRYGTADLSVVMTSAAAVLGVPGFSNVLSLPQARKVCVVMADGLGKSLLKARSGHAPFLRSKMENSRTLDAAFPTTTAASLSSLGTGVSPGQHGIVGYDVVDPAVPRVVNMLGNWPEDLDPKVWQPYPTVMAQAAEHIHVATASLPRFSDSALTRASLQGGEFLAAGTPQARVRAATEALAASDRSLVYCYWNELDKAGHKFGSDSSQWLSELEELDANMRTLAGRVPAGTLLLLVADHGMVDVRPEARIDYSQYPELLDGIALTAGEPRAVQLHFSSEATAATRSALIRNWKEAFGAKAWVITREEAIEHGYFGDVDERVKNRIGDVLILASGELALFDGRRVSPGALNMIGQHGSMTRAEKEVPLLTLATPK